MEVQSRTSCEDLIGNLNKEIKRLNKCYCERTDCAGRIKNSAKFDSVQEENERLNNIINEFEEYLKKVIETSSEQERITCSFVLQYLQELKGSDKE